LCYPAGLLPQSLDDGSCNSQPDEMMHKNVDTNYLDRSKFYRGVVCQFNHAKGFGFIRSQELTHLGHAKHEVFVHISENNSMEVGQIVRFNLMERQGSRPKAINVNTIFGEEAEEITEREAKAKTIRTKLETTQLALQEATKQMAPKDAFIQSHDAHAANPQAAIQEAMKQMAPEDAFIQSHNAHAANTQTTIQEAMKQMAPKGAFIQSQDVHTTETQAEVDRQGAMAASALFGSLQPFVLTAPRQPEGDTFGRKRHQPHTMRDVSHKVAQARAVVEARLAREDDKGKDEPHTTGRKRKHRRRRSSSRSCHTIMSFALRNASKKKRVQKEGHPSRKTSHAGTAVKDPLCPKFLDGECFDMACNLRHTPGSEEEVMMWLERFGGRMPCRSGSRCEAPGCNFFHVGKM